MYLLELAGDSDAFAVREAESRCSAVEAIAPGMATARGVDRPDALAYTRRVCRLIGTFEPDVGTAVALLTAATVERTGTVAVRARDVRGLTGIDTQAIERRLGSVLVDRGFGVDLDEPDWTLVALFSEGVAALGWLETETVRDFSTRKPTDKPFFQPGSMDPMDARALSNIAGAAPGKRILDPMCGTGGILVEAGLSGADVVGVDVFEIAERVVHVETAAAAEFVACVVGDVDPLCRELTQRTAGGSGLVSHTRCGTASAASLLRVRVRAVLKLRVGEYPAHRTGIRLPSTQYQADPPSTLMSWAVTCRPRSLAR
ncbi:MAG: TIGR01177 family methyltransferase [Natronomonas sp.]|nr:TIGR01177 family methyltransferase [Natronomonas sp.]